MKLSDQPELKRMMFQYRESQDPADFLPILAMVDRFLVNTMYMLRSRLFSLIGREDPQELYQLAIISLYKACNSMREGTADLDMRPRIISYMKEEFKNTFRKGRREHAMSTLALTIDPARSDETMKLLVLSDFRSKVAALFHSEALDPVDFSMFCCHFGFGNTYAQIAQEYKVSEYRVKMGITEALKVLRENMDPEDFRYD